MKTKEELLGIKQRYEAVKAELKELSEDELMLVTGGLIGIGGGIFTPTTDIDKNTENKIN